MLQDMLTHKDTITLSGGKTFLWNVYFQLEQFDSTATKTKMEDTNNLCPKTLVFTGGKLSQISTNSNRKSTAQQDELRKINWKQSSNTDKHQCDPEIFKA